MGKGIVSIFSTSWWWSKKQGKYKSYCYNLTVSPGILSCNFVFHFAQLPPNINFLLSLSPFPSAFTPFYFTLFPSTYAFVNLAPGLIESGPEGGLEGCHLLMEPCVLWKVLLCCPGSCQCQSSSPHVMQVVIHKPRVPEEAGPPPLSQGWICLSQSQT